MPGTMTPTRLDFDLDVERKTEDAPDYEDAPWYCLRTESFPCPAPGCDFIALFVTAAHLIVVWPERDDPLLLWHASLAVEVGRNPRVERWRPQFGACIAYDYWVQIGRPIHGRLDTPEGWDSHGPAFGGR